MNCFYHPQVQAIRFCERCNRALCGDCDFEGLCFENAAAAVQVDYKIAQGRVIKLWVFTVLVAVGLNAAMIASISEGSAPAGVLLLTIPLFTVGAWFFYMGMSWIYEKVRGRGPSVGVGVVTSGRGIGSSLIGGGRMSADPYGSIFGIFIVVAVITLLIAFLAWPIMIIGMFTGVKKYKLDRKIIRVVRSGEWLEWFPGKWNPSTQQHIPLADAPRADPEPEPVI